MGPSTLRKIHHISYSTAMKGLVEYTGKGLKECMSLWMEYRGTGSIGETEIFITDYLRLVEWISKQERK